jgi:beta-glucanase (GH16 family)
MTLGAATPASAAGSSSASAKVRLAVAAPSRGSTVADTAQLDFTGANLTAVTIYRVARPIATATVTPDGTAAHALVDTTRFPDGPLLLTAVGRGGSAGRQVAVAPMLVRVDNAHADRHPAGYRLVFRDEFGGAGLDRSKWCTRYQYDGGPAPQVPDPACLSTDPATGATLGTLDTLGGDGTQQGQESEVYRDVNNVGKTMHTQQDGYLSLHATATRADQPYLKYESAMIRSKREYQPTAEHPLYLTARVRLPDVLGTWPAFWLAGGYGDGRVRPPWPPEIDILEGPLNNHGNTANVLWTAVQTWGCDGPCPQGPVQATYADPRWDGNAYKADASLRDRWIEVGLEWHPDHVCWYLDGGKFGCVTYRWVANDGPDATNPASVLLNLGVGGPWAGADGVDDAKFPAHYDIDHVRIYAR